MPAAIDNIWAVLNPGAEATSCEAEVDANAQLVRLEEEGMEPGLSASSTGPASSTCSLVMLVHPFWQKHSGSPRWTLFGQRSTATSELPY